MKHDLHDAQSSFSQAFPSDVEYLQVYEGEVSRLG